MKSLFVALTLISFFYTGYSADNDAVVDFRKILWGTPKDSIMINGKKPEFIRDKTTILKNAYYINGDDMTIGAVKLDKVLYIFNDDNRFYKVFLQGSIEQAQQMKFILNYKFGDFKNETYIDDSHIMTWQIKDVTFNLKEISKSRFELTIESNWQASEDYKKNTNVNDF